jgi:PKD repeat protein
MFRLFPAMLAALATAAVPPAGAASLQPGWPQSAGDVIYSSAALGDLDGDGKLEVVIGSTNGLVYAWDTDGSALLGWPQTTGDLIYSSPALADLNEDGELEVVIGSTDGKVYAWDTDGGLLDGWPQTTLGSVESSPAVVDLDGDGHLEVVVGSNDYRVYAWHADGSAVTGWPVMTGDWVNDTPAVADLDGDGVLEVVAASWDRSVYAWHADGAPVEGWPQSTGDLVPHSLALGDLDGDGTLEVVAGSIGDTVYAWHADGTVVTGWPRATGDAIWSSTTLGDIDGDGALEVVAEIGYSGRGAVSVWRADGTAAAGWPQSTVWGGYVHSSPALGDMDGDGKLEVVIGSWMGQVYAWHDDGTAVEGWPQALADPVGSSPALGDVDGDGKLEVVAGCYDTNVYVWKCDTTTDDPLPWPFFRHDAQRTARYLPAAPGADFSGLPTAGTAPLAVQFADRSSGHPATWLWSFGDGMTSSEQNPNHEYTAAGLYTVSLTVSNTAGSDTETKTNFVMAAAPLAANFAANPRTGPAPLLVQFTDMPTGTPTAWSWSFGDGGTATDRNPAHTYDAAGSYTVSLTITNGTASDTETKDSYITVSDAPPALQAEFVAAPAAGVAPLAVQFADQSVGSITGWQWDFGDGGTATEQDPAHTYNDAGSYTVTLTVTDGGGSDSDTKPDYILVIPPLPVADFSGTPTAGVAPLSVQFTDLSTSSPTAWSWDFGDGATSDEQDPSHTFAPGRHTVALTAANASGSDRMEKSRYLLVTFPDVPLDPEHWALYQILACVDAGIVQGYSDGSYQPENTVTRDQMAVYISRAVAGGEGNVHVPTSVAEPTFTDVGEDQWAYRYIEYCAGNGLVQGYADGSYHPDQAVNRGQMAVYIARAVVSPPGDASVPEAPAGDPTFPDVTADNDWSWCYKHVEYCAAQGIVQGYADGTYGPGNPVTRDQMAVYIQRAFKLPL